MGTYVCSSHPNYFFLWLDRSACISTCGWWLGLASVCNFVATMALAIVQLCVEGYTIHPWHQWFGYVAVLWLAILLNIVGIRFLPLLNRYLCKFKLPIKIEHLSLRLFFVKCIFHSRPSSSPL